MIFSERTIWNGLIAAAAGLGSFQLYNALMKDWTPESSQNIGNELSVNRSISQTKVEASPTSTYAKSLERPLFHKSRRPLPPKPLEPVAQDVQPQPPPAAPPPLVKPPLSESYSLRGVMIVKGKGFALFERKDGTGLVNKPVGELLDGWTIEAVEPEKVILSLDGNKDEIELVKPGSGIPDIQTSTTVLTPPEPPQN